MYLRKQLEEELLNDSLMDVTPERAAMNSVIEIHHAQEIWARQCARRVFDVLIVGTARKHGLRPATELIMDSKWLEDIFRDKYQVESTHISLSVSMVQQAWMQVLTYFKDHSYGNGKG